mgnify:CR=1 FL=1
MSPCSTIIAGTGFYSLAQLEDAQQLTVETDFGTAQVTRGKWHGVEVAFLTRHGAGHSVPPHLVNYRANIAALVVMLAASAPISAFVDRHPTVKMLALAFLLLIGMVLVADGFGFHVPKGFIYAAIGFSVFVEGLNMMARRRGRSGT